MLQPIADELESLGLPHEWVRCVIRHDATTVYEDSARELAAQKAGAWYEDAPGVNGLHYPRRFFNDTGQLKGLSELSPDDAATLLEEVFHAWFDQCSGAWATMVGDDPEEALSAYIHHLIERWLFFRGEPAEDINFIWPRIVQDARGEIPEEQLTNLKEEGLDFESPPHPGLPDTLPDTGIAGADDWSDNAQSGTCNGFCRVTEYRLVGVNELVDVQVIVDGAFNKPDITQGYDITAIGDFALRQEILRRQALLEARRNETFTRTTGCDDGCECVDSGTVLFDGPNQFTAHTETLRHGNRQVAITWRVQFAVKIRLGVCKPASGVWF